MCVESTYLGPLKKADSFLSSKAAAQRQETLPCSFYQSGGPLFIKRQRSPLQLLPLPCDTLTRKQTKDALLEGYRK